MLRYIRDNGRRIGGRERREKEKRTMKARKNGTDRESERGGKWRGEGGRERT